MIKFRALVKISFFVGMMCGLVAAPFLALARLMDGEYMNAIVVFVFAPILNGAFIAIYAIVAFPVLKFFSDRKWLAIDELYVDEVDLGNGKNSG